MQITASASAAIRMHSLERIDPTRPMKSWRSAWRQITKAAGIPRLRFHDLRHHAITELAESQASDQTIMSVAGHVSQRMRLGSMASNPSAS
jgi:integrase